jgi:hypothetical protein
LLLSVISFTKNQSIVCNALDGKNDKVFVGLE